MMKLKIVMEPSKIRDRYFQYTKIQQALFGSASLHLGIITGSFLHGLFCGVFLKSP